LQHVLNRGEAVHVVHRAIHVGRIPVELARREDSLSAVSSVMTLLANILMAWNPHMQHALDVLQASGGESPGAEQLRRIAPTHLEGINLRGTFISPRDAMQADCSQAWLKIPRRLSPVSSRSEVTTTRLRVDSKSMIYNDIQIFIWCRRESLDTASAPGCGAIPMRRSVTLDLLTSMSQ
jgi:Tn3 transposase DDE domain